MYFYPLFFVELTNILKPALICLDCAARLIATTIFIIGKQGFFIMTACGAYNARQNIRIYSLSGRHAALCLFLLYDVYFVTWIYRLSLICIRDFSEQPLFLFL